MNVKDFIEKVKFVITKQKGEDRFPLAEEAYQLAEYNDRLTKDQIKELLIRELKKRIVSDFKLSGKFINISTYDGYREKLLLPEIAEFFRDRGYCVDLLNKGDYEKVNVLIINWQNKETFK